MPKSTKPNLQRDTLRKLSAKDSNPLIPLRIEYSEKSKLLTGYINKLIDTPRIYPTFLPTQASFRWSTLNPPITNWPRACVNLTCQTNLEAIYGDKAYHEHEWTDICWSVRDILKCDNDEVLITWDHDNIEGRIGSLVLNDTEELDAFNAGWDLHTINCCNLFDMELPQDKLDPHNSDIDASWRAKYNWQGKDTPQRILAKNFSHGARYANTWRFIYTILDKLAGYGVTRKEAIRLAKEYEISKAETFRAKRAIMAKIKKDRVARTLYGGRRLFFDSSDNTGKEGFSHMISGTVSDFNNETLILLDDWLGDDVRLLHNAHDGDKIAVRKDKIEQISMYYFTDELSRIIERPVSYQGRSIMLTAGVKVYE